MGIIKTTKLILQRNNFIIGTALSISLVLLLMRSCGGVEGDTISSKKDPLVITEMIEVSDIVHSLELTGEIVPVKNILISSMVEGPITFCPWREGDHVEDGEKLIEINREIYRAEVTAAEAALAVAEAKLNDMREGTRPEEIEKARQSVREAEQNFNFEKSEFDKITQLVNSGALPGEELEKSRVKLTSAEAKLISARKHLEMLELGHTRTAIAVQQEEVKEASAKLDLAKARLSESMITAPFAGTITKVYVHEGDTATAKSPLLEMSDLKSLVVRCAVPEAQSSVVRRGMKADVRLDALPSKVLSAEVIRVFPELDPLMRTRTIELMVHDEVDFAQGMFARVRLILDTIPDAITVPVQSVMVSSEGTSIVFVAKDGKAMQRKVQTGFEESGRIQILSGLNSGEQVIISGQENLKDGAEIRQPNVQGSGQSKDKQSSHVEVSQ